LLPDPILAMTLDKDLESIQETRELVEKAADAQKILARFSQQQIDAVVSACAEAARQNAEMLARLAVEETTYGIVADKIEKTLFSARDVYNAIKDLKTVGIIREDPANGIVEIAVPAGVVAAIIPCTNPTSTAVFKALIALKGANTIVMSPHPSAVKCISETARVIYDAAVKAGAPEGCLACLSHPTMEATQELMRHRRTAIILATGGAGLVRSAYSSGKPALGVGPGNVPAYIHSSAEIGKAVGDILDGKTFDNGTICSSEQHMVVDQLIADRVRVETEREGGFFLTPEQAEAVSRLLILPNLRVNSKMVGQSADRIASEAAFRVPPGTRALVAPLEGIGKQYPLSAEKLSPVLSFYPVANWREGLDVCKRFLEFGGMGHTMAIHATEDHVIRELALQLPAFRLVVNTPATLGSIGYTTNLFPSMSLGCGTPGGNITSDNISPMHLINIKRLAYERRTVQRPKAALRSSTRVDKVSPQPDNQAEHSSVVLANPTPNARNLPSSAEISRIVDRFLGVRPNSDRDDAHGEKPGAPVPLGSSLAPGEARNASGDTQSKVDSRESESKSGIGSAPQMETRPVEFVSEQDAREAIRQGRKIHVGAKTIITPSARELGDPCELFVLIRS
jgi:acetaldehyde dehydrogenase (acetylating)